jgi:hypothetical protein
VDELKRFCPTVVLDSPTDYSVENLSDSPRETKVIEPSIGAIRSEDAALLRELGYPAIPDKLRAYNDYCALDPDAQRDLILRLLNAAAEMQNQAAWDAAADLIDRMRLVFKRHGVKHLHFEELRLALDDMDRPKPGKKRSPKGGDQRKALMKTLVAILVKEFGIKASYNKDKKPSQTKVKSHDCACAIVARVCKAHFQDKKFTESAAWTAYYRG